MEDKTSRPPETRTIEVDTRGMEPPEPILTILKRTAEMTPGMVMRVRIDSNPWQLYDLLQQRGFIYETERSGDGKYLGKIRFR